MALEIIGREQELGAVHALLDRATGGPAALVLEGEAGIGKSTLWLAGVEAARERGFCVLSSRPAEAERGLAHVVLSDLFERVLDEVLPALSAPRRHALEVALLVDEASEQPVDPRTLGVAVRTALQTLAERTPVVLAIDDVQWLDPSSASALAFALRRMAPDRVLLLLARRLVEGTQPSELERALEAESVQRLAIGPLSVGALHRFLRDRLGRPFARQTLLRIHEASGGNPFFALELARALGSDVDPLRPLPVPETLEELVRARLVGLPAPTREALELASALGAPSASLLERAGIAPDALEAAVDAHVIEREDEIIRFSHPLLSSVLYQSLSSDERGSLHRRLAAIMDDPLVRARHLALATDTTDADVAGILDEAATLATGRGAGAVAAELGEHALRLTPPDAHADRHRRALAAARAHRIAGEWIRARTIVADLLAQTQTGSLRAEALVLLAELESVERAIALLAEALDEAASRPALQAAIHCRLAWATRFGRGFEHARAALELAEKLDDEVLRGRARAVQAFLGWFAGETESPQDLPARAHDFADSVGGEKLVQEATLAVANTLAPSSRREEARTFFQREHHEWHERDEPRSARALWGLSWVEFWAGHWNLAAEHAARAHDISIQYGLEVPQDHLPIALVAVHRGQLELARAHSERALELAEEQFVRMLHPPQHLAILGLVSLWSGDPSAAGDWLAKADRQAAELGWGEPSVRWWTPDHAELLLEDGRIDEAIRLIDVWDLDAARVRREWVLAHVTRCRGLVVAAQGNVDRADFLLQQAVAQHEEVGDPFGRARAQLALGTVRRRARQKRSARDAIEAGLAGFEQLGAATWVQKARGELGQIGGRTRQEGLTDAERRVAALVAEGRTNREVAAALFLTERTIASHLTHVYAKLGIRSRTELARRLD
ncbi:MAG TPA: AAA family ATPase [Gaiellaceae bacterium]|nr:AAA family ATPase [Gaiellaceae bacterium]